LTKYIGNLLVIKLKMKYFIVRLQDSQTEWEYRIVKAINKEAVQQYFKHIRYVDVYTSVDNILEILDEI